LLAIAASFDILHVQSSPGRPLACSVNDTFPAFHTMDAIDALSALQELLSRARRALDATGVWLIAPARADEPMAVLAQACTDSAPSPDVARRLAASLPLSLRTSFHLRPHPDRDNSYWLIAPSVVVRTSDENVAVLLACRQRSFAEGEAAVAENFAHLAAVRMAPQVTTPLPVTPALSDTAAQAPKAPRATRQKVRTSADPSMPAPSVLDPLTQVRNELVAARSLNDALIESIPGAFLLLDERGRLLRWNLNIERIVGYSAQRLNKITISELVAEPDRDLARQALRELLGSNETITAEINVLHADQQVVPYQLRARRVAIGGKFHILIIARDVTERHRAERDIRQAKARLDLAMASSGVALWDWDIIGGIVYLNEGFARLMLLSEDDGHRPATVVSSWTHPDDRERFQHALLTAIKSPSGEFDCEYRIVRSDGEVLWVLSRGRATEHAPDGKATRLLGTSMNITARKQAEERVEFLATRDALTGLPNRVLLADRLEQGIVQAARNRGSLAFMFIDLDRFKTINDSLGHAVGDELLKRATQRMLACVRASDTVARLGGDEFAIIVSELNVSEGDGARSVAEKVVAALAMPMQVDTHTLNTSCSIGVSLFPRDGRDSATLMRNADVAMYHAKEKGRNNYQFFSADMNARAQEKLTTENYLRLAVRRNELVLVYQPRFAMDLTLIGAEALLRWQHPRRGLIGPDAFISVAEESGMIVNIGEWVLEVACNQLAAWRARLPDFQMSVNLSVEQIRDGERMYSSVANALRAMHLPGQALELELTESILMQSVKEKVPLLTRLGELGVSLAIDDFGTGYSSLSYLKQLPVDTIKIDASFVRDLVDDPNDHAIVQAILSMAKNLSLATVAEGVETQAQLDQLRRLGCDEFQGYLMSRPLMSADFERQFLAPP
jgi:diguanylate cyclase (GGDEF)-like protein/PAS domain S-box-containing protein